MPDSIMWICAALSVWGTVLNLYGRRSGFAFWMTTNAAWVAYDLSLSAWPQAALMAVYFTLSVWGWFKWTNPVPHSKGEEQ